MSKLIRIVVFAVSAACLGSVAWAQSASTAQEGGDFTFKRVGPPKTAVGNRIDVQIDPEAEIFRITPGAETRRPGDPRPDAATQLPAGLIPEGPTTFDWFWEAVSPASSADAAVRFATSLEVLQRNATQVPTPRLTALQQIISEHKVDILTATVGTRVSPALVLAVISVESGGRVQVVSDAGAVGLMQLIPATASRFGISDSTDPKENIKGGVAYLDWLLSEFDGDPILALAGYNAGEGAVGKHGGVPPFAETRAYVPKVLAAWNVARALCLTPPVLISDGCVFGSQTASGG